MKKIFSREKYIKWCKKLKNGQENFGWAKQCDGLTLRECEALGYMISDLWILEVEE